MDFNKRAGYRIRELRESAGLTQQQLLERLHDWGLPRLHQTQMAHWEAGRRPLKLQEAHAIAAILGVEMSVLLEGTEDLDIAALEARQHDAEQAIEVLQRANAVRLADTNHYREELARLDREIRQAGALIERHRATIVNAEQRIANINDGETEEDLADAGNGYEEI